MESSKCNHCGTQLTNSNWWPSFRKNSTYTCKDCGRRLCAERTLNNVPRYLLTKAKSRAKQYRIPFTITEQDVMVPEVCPVLGIELQTQVGRGKGHAAASPTLDRLDPNRGYVPGNVCVISFRANQLKNNATPNELRLVAEWVEKEENDA